MILEGTTSSGAVVPVQVTDQGRVVAEGLQGPQGQEGPQGPEGPPGPAGGYWDRTGTVVSPTNDGDSLELTSGGTAGVSLDPGSTGSPLVRDADGRLLVGTSTSPSAYGAFSKLVVEGYIGGTGGGYAALQRAQATGDVGSSSEIGALDFTDQTGNVYAEVVARRNGAKSAADSPGALIFKTTKSGDVTTSEAGRFDSAGVFTIGDASAGGSAVAVSLDPGSTGVPLVRDSVGRLLVGMNNAPAGTLAGDVVCQGSVVLQSPDGMWWAIEVANDGTLFASQTAIR